MAVRQSAPDPLARVRWEEAAWPDESPAGPAPGWHAWFCRAWAARSPQRWLPSLGGLGLLEAARPLIAHAQAELFSALDAMDLPPSLASLPDLLPAQPPLPWLGMCVLPTMTAELAAARRSGALDGETPEQRFDGFARGLAEPAAALAIWGRCPALARQVAEMLSDWVQARLEFARHLAADLPLLGRLCPGADPGALTGVRFGAGETHRRGRIVAVADFAGGAVVYKPRSLAIDARFDALLGWFNDGAPAHPLRRLALLDRGDHGWCEHVGAAPCSAQEAPAYFWRLGALLALAYLLHGFDLHADNVIAAGPDPVVVDLEALFHTGGSQPLARAGRLSDPAASLLAESVLASGLLPGPLVMPDVETGRPFGVDISPMGITPSRRSLIRAPAIVGGGTDRMRVEHRYQEVPAPAGRLTVAGGDGAAPGDRAGEVAAGFVCAYERLRQAGESLLAPGGPLGGCEEAPVRLVQLSTFLYARMLIDSWHPDSQRRASDRDRSFARLRAGWPGVPHRGRLVAAEIAALRRGEVPVFEIRPGHADVWLEDGARLPGVLAERPLAALRRRLRALGPADLAAQAALIEAALAAADPARPARPGRAARPARPAQPRGAGDPPALLAAAKRIAARLDQTAVRDGRRIGWIATEVVDARHRRIAPAGLELYGGLPGIGLFLSCLAAATGDERAARLALEVGDEVVARCAADAALPGRQTGDRGIFGPLAGPLYYLAHASHTCRRPDYAEAARALLAGLAGAPAASGSPGLAEGPAGWLTALLALHAVSPSPEVRHHAEAAAALVIDSAEHAAEHAAERAGARAPEPGPAFGPSGAALALARWHAVSGDQRSAAAARSLLAGDGARQGAVFPLGAAGRPGAVDPAASAGWCLGAAGAGLARRELAALPAFADVRAQLLAEAAGCAAAVAAALPSAPDDSLCHGRAGMALMLAGCDPRRAPGVAVPARGEPGGWRLALPGPAPGLFPGLAGIGLCLVALARPSAVPQVLLFAPPPAAHERRT